MHLLGGVPYIALHNCYPCSRSDVLPIYPACTRLAAQHGIAADRFAREIVAFVRLFTIGGVALQEPCLNRDTRTEWPASERGTLRGRKPTDNEPVLRARSGERGQVLRPMLTRETCVESVVTIKWRNWLILRHDQNGTRMAATIKSAAQTVPNILRRQAGSYGALPHISNWNEGTPLPLDPQGVRKCQHAGRRAAAA